MIRISDAAQTHFIKLLANQEEGTQIRVFVINPGTPNAEYGVSYCPSDAVEAIGTALKFGLLTAYINGLSAPYLEDAGINFVTDQLDSQLTLKAPNAKMRKVADDAPLMERVGHMLQSQINPQPTDHNGRVSLMEITEDGYAILQFSGNCNGYSMVDVTLRGGIEKQLLNEFPELKGIRDLTEYQRGEHSYYQVIPSFVDCPIRRQSVVSGLRWTCARRQHGVALVNPSLHFSTII